MAFRPRYAGAEISAAYRDNSLADLRQMQIEADLETDAHAWSATLRLAEKHELTLYDAAYLELAQRRRLPLATLDRELRRAADRIGVAVLGVFSQEDGYARSVLIG